MKLIIYILLCAGMLTIGLQGCATQVHSTSSHAEPIVTMTNKQALIDELNKTIALANHEIEQKNWQQANLHIKSGVNTLGYRYLNPNIVDDSDMYLLEADVQERDGKLESATRQRLRTLQRRFELFQMKP